MNLTEDQTNAVKTWISEGLSLSKVQEKLHKEFNLSITYMDVRFLLDDLDISLPEKEKKEVHEKVEDESVEDTLKSEPVDGVSLDVDAVQRPGITLGGSVTFSDGVQAQWQIDAMGQLGIIPKTEDKNYRPSNEDIQEFQMKLQQQLQKKGI